MSSNKELMQRRSQAIPRGVGQIHPIFADRAENCRVLRDPLIISPKRNHV